MVLTIPLPELAVYWQQCLCANIRTLHICGINQLEP